ncbi:hypothetical protein B0H14DRAFT_2621019 [Mycena olivaceomarginata]|nr:hypothetical protein B0H14DRAFT_2621019 [Mycena olivaceomarginata]
MNLDLKRRISDREWATKYHFWLACSGSLHPVLERTAGGVRRRTRHEPPFFLRPHPPLTHLCCPAFFSRVLTVKFLYESGHVYRISLRYPTEPTARTAQGLPSLFVSTSSVSVIVGTGSERESSTSIAAALEYGCLRHEELCYQSLTPAVIYGLHTSAFRERQLTQYLQTNRPIPLSLIALFTVEFLLGGFPCADRQPRLHDVELINGRPSRLRFFGHCSPAPSIPQPTPSPTIIIRTFLDGDKIIRVIVGYAVEPARLTSLTHLSGHDKFSGVSFKKELIFEILNIKSSSTSDINKLFAPEGLEKAPRAKAWVNSKGETNDDSFRKMTTIGFKKYLQEDHRKVRKSGSGKSRRCSSGSRSPGRARKYRKSGSGSEDSDAESRSGRTSKGRMNSENSDASDRIIPALSIYHVDVSLSSSTSMTATRRQPRQPAQTACMKAFRDLLIAAFRPEDKHSSIWAAGLDRSREYAERNL